MEEERFAGLPAASETEQCWLDALWKAQDRSFIQKPYNAE